MMDRGNLGHDFNEKRWEENLCVF